MGENIFHIFWNKINGKKKQTWQTLASKYHQLREGQEGVDKISCKSNIIAMRKDISVIHNYSPSYFGLTRKPASWSEGLGNLLIPLSKLQHTFCEEMWPMATQWHWRLSKVICSNGFQVIVVTEVHINNVITITSTIFGQDFRYSAVIIVINCQK